MTTSDRNQPVNPDGTPGVAADPVATIEAQWLGRAASMGLKPGSAKYMNAEEEFFTGAMAALASLGYAGWCPPQWFVAIIRGTPVAKRQD